MTIEELEKKAGKVFSMLDDFSSDVDDWSRANDKAWETRRQACCFVSTCDMAMGEFWEMVKLAKGLK